MKILTVLAAALAAGVMSFAANAQEDKPQLAAIAIKPDETIAVKPADEGATEDKSKQDPSIGRGLTGEEVSHAIQAYKKDANDKPYTSIIERHAARNGVSIQLAHAVISVESNYRPDSRGKAGEVGLMQIKPATAKLMGYSGSVTGLFDPETNIEFGMKYLGQAQKLGNGTTCGTILKYNAGHGAKRMNPISRDYCLKVKRHIVDSLSWLWATSEDYKGV
jgi:soluble lytic murein transglycosylase-like protein